jgi:hypothetical protein
VSDGSDHVETAVLNTLCSDTEAGRMLAKLYGSKTKPTVEYPKVRTKPLAVDALPTFVPAGGKADVDNRSSTRKVVSVAVPRPGAGEEVGIYRCIFAW